MQPEQRKALESKAHWVRCKVLDMATHAKSGHISSAFSQTELLVSLYHGRLMNYDPKNPRWEQRDRFILSKGQGGIGFYPVLADLGFFPLSELDDFAGRGNLLGVHAEHHVPGMEILSGSLGHGLPVATGVAQIGLLKKQPWLVICLLGDGELDEGQSWEAVMLASKNKLGNLIAIVDRNNIQIDGFTEDVMPMESLRTKWEAFNWHVIEIDGHDFREIIGAINQAKDIFEKPSVIIAHTIPGRGVKEFERNYEWHGKPPNKEETAMALKELRTLGGKIKSEHE